MARILCAWELGSDLGHLSHLRLPIEMALQLGHEVVLAARHLARVKEVLGDMPITYLQAPFKQYPMAADQSAFPSYTHLLARQCFQGVDELEAYLRAWTALFHLVQPDMVLYEHSPTALIASRACRFKKVLVGNGFAIPPVSGAPFAPFITTPRTDDIRAALCADDAVLLQVINLALSRLDIGGFAAVQDIYGQADEQWLMTLPALDHFGSRPEQRYLGVEAPRARAAPVWPTGSGPKVFGYLHAIPSLEKLLQDLLAANVCALLHVRNLPPSLKAAYTSENLHFIDHLVDLSLVAQQTAWVINHGNHNTVASFLRAGIPQLVIPMHQEHLFAGLRLAEQACVVVAYQDQPGFLNEIKALNSDPKFKQGAERVSAGCPSLEALNAPGYIRQRFQDLLD